MLPCLLLVFPLIVLFVHRSLQWGGPHLFNLTQGTTEAHRGKRPPQEHTACAGGELGIID